MKKITKPLIIISIALLLGLLVAVVLVPALIDPNHYKPEIAAWVKSKTGRDIKIEGDIKLTWFPWIGFSAGQVKVSDKPGFQETPFLSVDNSDIKVKLIPLLKKKIEVNSITLKGLTLNLNKNKLGINNWDDLFIAAPSLAGNAGATPPAGQNSQSGSVLATLTAGAINIDKGTINWVDQQTLKKLTLKDIQLSVDQFIVNKPLKIIITTYISGSDIKFSGILKWSAVLQVNDKLDKIAFKDSQIDWTGSDQAKPTQYLTAKMMVPNAEYNNKEQAIKMVGVNFQAGDIHVSADMVGEGLLEKPVLKGTFKLASFNPRTVMKQWGLPIPQKIATDALTKFAMVSQVQWIDDTASFNGMDVELDNSHIKGNASVKNFTQPGIGFDLTVDVLDADRYLSPNEFNIVSPGMALAAGTYSVPLDWLKKLDAEGKLTLGKLNYNRMTLQDVSLTLKASHGIVKIAQNANRVYKGTYKGDFKADASSGEPTIEFSEELANIQIEPLLKDTVRKAKIGGTANVSSHLSGQGSNIKEFRKHLSGKVSFFLKDGFVKGFNLEKIIDNGKKLLKNGSVPVAPDTDRTAINVMRGTATLSDSILQNDDLIAKTTKLRSTGKGNANLNNGQLHYTLTTKLIKTGGAANQPEQTHNTPIVIDVSGTFEKPVFSLDIAALLTDKNKKKIERLLGNNKDKIEKLMNKLDKKLGPKAGDLLKKIF